MRRAHENPAGDDHLRVEKVDYNRAGAAEHLPDLPVNLNRKRVALVGKVADQLGCDVSFVFAGALPQKRRFPLFKLAADIGGAGLGDPAAGAPALDRAALAVADRVILTRSQPDMPDLPGAVVGSAVKPAVEDKPGAEAGAEGNEDHVLRPPAGAPLPLGDGAGVGVVLKPRLDAEAPFEKLLDMNAVPAGQVRRREDYPPLRIERPAAGDAYPCDIPRRNPGFFDRLRGVLRKQLHNFVGSLSHRREFYFI